MEVTHEDLINYSDYRTVEELLQFIENIKKAFDMTWPITLANRYS